MIGCVASIRISWSKPSHTLAAAMYQFCTNLIICDRIILWIIIKEAMAETEVTKRGLNCRIHSKVSLGPINWAKNILESLCIQKDVNQIRKHFAITQIVLRNQLPGTYQGIKTNGRRNKCMEISFREISLGKSCCRKLSDYSGSGFEGM